MEQNIYLNLAKARIEIQKKCTKKSGHNKFVGFDYFELKDFLSVATEELYKAGLVALFNMRESFDENGVKTENAELIITDGSSNIKFETPTADAYVKGANDIQNLGSKHTYLKRYLYLNALELSENDSTDATIGKEEVKEEKPLAKATPKQIEMITKLYDEENIAKMLEYYHLEKLEDMDIKTASEVIARKRGK